MPRTTTIVELNSEEVQKAIVGLARLDNTAAEDADTTVVFEGWSISQGERVKVECDSLSCKVTFTEPPAKKPVAAKGAGKKERRSSHD